MNMEKLTNKSREALLEAQNIAVGNRNTELRDIHVLAALMRQEDGLVPSLLEKLGVSRQLFSKQVDEALAKLPTVQGGEQQVYQSREFSTLHVDAASRPNRCRTNTSASNTFCWRCSKRPVPARSNC